MFDDKYSFYEYIRTRNVSLLLYMNLWGGGWWGGRWADVGVLGEEKLGTGWCVLS